VSNLLPLVISAAEDCLPARPDGSPGVNVWSAADGQLCAFSGSRGGHHWLHWPGVASFRFSADGGPVTAVPYPPPQPDVIRTTFYHSVLPLAMQALGREGLHASAVSNANGTVTGFCGKAHTGKSTLAYALSHRGFTAWADDALVWELRGDQPTAIRLPFEVRLRPPVLSFFGHESHSDVSPPRPHTATHAPLSALCVLTPTRIDSGAPPVSIERITGARALTTLLDHAHCFNPYNAVRKRQMLDSYLALLRRVPVFAARFQPVREFRAALVDAISEFAARRN
jgi:hypothetical protein